MSDSLPKEAHMEGDPTTKQELIDELLADVNETPGERVVDAMALAVSELIRVIPDLAAVATAAREYMNNPLSVDARDQLFWALKRLDEPLSDDFLNAAAAISDAPGSDHEVFANWS